jgi:hypothetical protein
MGSFRGLVWEGGGDADMLSSLYAVRNGCTGSFRKRSSSVVLDWWLNVNMSTQNGQKTARNHHSLQEYRAITSIAALASVEMTRLDKKRSAPGTGMLEKSLPKESIPESDIPSQIGHTMLAARLGMGKSAVIDARRGLTSKGALEAATESLGYMNESRDKEALKRGLELVRQENPWVGKR